MKSRIHPTYKTKYRVTNWALAKIDHPNVVRIHAVDSRDGEIRLVLELLRGRTHLWRPEGSGWGRILAALDRARELAAHGNYRLHVSMYPTLHWIQGDYPLAEAHAHLAEACRARGVPFHDLLPAFAGRDPRGLWVHALDQHPNAAGHRLAAELLADQLAPAIPP